jgi:hypothetical protein
VLSLEITSTSGTIENSQADKEFSSFLLGTTTLLPHLGQIAKQVTL